MEAEPPRRRRLTLSLRVMMLLVLVVACWLGSISNKARQQRVAVAAITQSHGSVRYDWEFVNGTLTPGREPAAPRWLRRALGDEFFQHVVQVDLRDYSPPEGRLQRLGPRPEVILAHLRVLPYLQRLYFDDDLATDEGLRNIAGLTDLEVLFIYGSYKLGDAGIAHLAGLKNLKWLMIENSRMTDQGLANLKGLTRLEILALGGGHVSDDGLVHVGGLKGVIMLGLKGGDNISDAGLAHLAKLTKLQYLSIQKGRVSDRGLECLRGLTKLRKISIGDTMVADEGIKKLKEAVPSLKSVVQ
jgi:hypothetical protein